MLAVGVPVVIVEEKAAARGVGAEEEAPGEAAEAVGEELEKGEEEGVVQEHAQPAPEGRL